MCPLTASELLDVWERGLIQRPVERALALLAAATPDTPPDVLAELSIGQRDARLLTLREWTFGPQLVSLASCPCCRERLELSFGIEDLRAAPEATDGEEPISLNVAGYELRFRLPNSADVTTVAAHEDTPDARQVLLERCLLAAEQDGVEKSADQLPANVVDAVEEAMSQADPQGEVQIAVSCPVCGHQWRQIFDVVSFFWSEIDAWAHRVLHDVHALASAYGWREVDILTMTPRRRQFYLGVIG